MTISEGKIIVEQAMKHNNILNNIKVSFDAWWHTDGSAMLQMPTEDTEEFVRRISKLAWFGGALKAVELTKDL